ncbi:MAG: hypothetical protein QOI47_1575 [Actinomycetota bacterium]|jgi:hypothetical protein|nr:hypothetical protein [Actinomycetota bacterium]
MLITHRRGLFPPPLFAIAGASVAVAAGVIISRQPLLVLAAAVVGVGMWLLLPRLTLVTSLLASSFFFDDFLTERFGFWNPGKLLGVLAAGSLLVTWMSDHRPLVWSRQAVVLLGMSGSLLISFTFAREPGVAMQVGVRYVMFFALFFIALQAVRRRADVDWLIDVLVIAATVASLIGLFNFFFNGYARVSGPMTTPGDFGFVLGSTVPLTVYRAAVSRGAARALRIAAALVILAAIIGTFARADIVGLTAAGAWVVISGRLRIRWVVVSLAAVALIGLTAYEVRPDLIENSLALKENVAQKNVDSRYGLWAVAVDEWQAAPIFGVGPGNYEVRFPEFKSPFRQKVETTHNAYLNILAELGLLGLALFVVFLVQSWGAVRRRAVERQDDWLQTAIAAGFLVALVGALFMTEQFYPPLWFLAALGVALDHLRDAEAVTT